MEIDKEIEDVVRQLFANKNKTMGDALQIEYTLFKKSRIEAKMPVNENTTQPFGLLHGGASVALGETLCSIGALLNIDTTVKLAVGMEINANHIRAVRSGFVTGIAEPIHKGATSQIWKFDILNDSGKLVCTGRCTLAVIDRK
jgi:1,4-dihydroxy-2-naphthoyl-CoA hydrolase